MFNYLCDDTVANVISFLDFRSAIKFAGRTSNRMRQRVRIHHKGMTHGGSITGKNASTAIVTVKEPENEKKQDNEYDDEYEYGTHCYHQLWRGFYHRQFFPPVDYCNNDNLDYIQLCKDKLQLLNNLTHERNGCVFGSKSEGKRKCAGSSSSSSGGRARSGSGGGTCFSIPNRCFHFRPVHLFIDDADADAASNTGNSNDNNGHDGADHYRRDADIAMDHAEDDYDFPSVEFPCASYALTSPSVGTEYVFLDPSDGSLTVHSDIMAHVAKKEKSEGAELLQDVISAFQSDENFTGADREEMHVAKMRSTTLSSTSEVLFSVLDFYHLDLNDYFKLQQTFTIPWQQQPQQPEQGRFGRNHEPIELAFNEEVVVEWIGIETYAMIDSQGNMVGNMICAGRELSVDNGGALPAIPIVDGEEVSLRSCTEIMAWKKMSSADKYGEMKYTLRMDGSPYYMEICAMKEQVFASFSVGRGDSHLSNIIHIFPLLANNDERSKEKDDNGRQFFANARNHIVCHFIVKCFVVEPTGTHLIVGTDNGLVEIWNLEGDPCLQERIDISEKLKEMVQSESSTARGEAIPMDDNVQLEEDESTDMEVNFSLDSSDDSVSMDEEQYMPYGRRRTAYSSALDHFNETIRSTEEDDNDNDEFIPSSREGLMEQMEASNVLFSLAQCKSDSAINQIVLPRHLPISKAGFFTLQYHRNEGTTLMFWQRGGNGSFDISSLVNLPLSAQRRPQVAYDGKRLVVFGQDHIGVIIMVYRVMSSREDFELGYHPGSNKRIGENSGGVVNLNDSKRIVYVNRIRHAGLGGIEYYDNMFMTFNERFVIVNTKTGNLLDSGDRSTEGLLVIDLES